MFYVLRLQKMGNEIDRVIAGPLTREEADKVYSDYQAEHRRGETDAVTLPASVFEEMLAAV